MKSENNILLVVNPISGSSEKDTIISTVSAEATLRNLKLEIYKTTGEKDKEAIEALLKKYRPQRVLVAGGDGTISLIAECLLGTPICLGIIPAGSANGIAVNFGIPESLPEQLEIALSLNFLEIDALCINDKLCLHIADLGINAALIKNYENSGIRGKLGYLLQSIPTIFNSEYPFHFTIQTNDNTLEKTGVLLAIANANKFGTGANINPYGKINDGKFEVLIFKNLDVIEILKTIQEKPELSEDFVEIISTDHAIVTTQTKVPFQIDGEYLGETRKITARIEEKRLTMAVPKTYSNLYAADHCL